MGEPYWRDVDEVENEIIAFHEFDGGRVEIQFEYPEMSALEVISILTPGIMSDQNCRESYRVTKPWPPSH